MNREFPRRLIVSFHDLAPGTQEVCQRFLTEMKTIGISRVSLLVVPDWYQCEPIQENESFMQWLRELQEMGHEIVLHGWCHQARSIQGSWWNHLVGRFYTSGEGEFYQMGYDEAKEKISQGRDIFRKHHIRIEGFIAPAWLLSQEAHRAVRDLRFSFTTYWGEIESLPPQRKIPAPTVVFSSRRGWRRWVSRLWCPFWQWRNRHSTLLRIAIHPADMNYPKMEALMLKLTRLALRDRDVMTYGELIEQWEASHE